MSAKKPYGQHFLFDPNILKKMIACAAIKSGDTVVEIGPGLGPLTKRLSERAGRVIAIEFDKRIFEKLENNLADRGNVELIRADAMKFNYKDINGPFKVVANIPYYITTPLIFRLLEYKNKIKSMTLLMQKEVAKRITAKHNTKEYGVLSISVRLYTKPSLKFTVSKRAFSPPPAVDSAVVHFDVSPEPLYDIKDVPLFNEMVRTAFSQRRKMISRSLNGYQDINKVLEEISIDPKLRPENLSIENFVSLSNALTESA